MRDGSITDWQSIEALHQLRPQYVEGIARPYVHSRLTPFICSLCHAAVHDNAYACVNHPASTMPAPTRNSATSLPLEVAMRTSKGPGAVCKVHCHCIFCELARLEKICIQ